MTIKSVKLGALLTICSAAFVHAQGQDNLKRDPLNSGLSISEVSEYRKMFRVNERPVDMVEETKYMCAPPSMMYGPHYDPGVVYYINKIAREGLKKYSDSKVFPVGSIIVKEKQERKTEDSVQIVTVMKKVRTGTKEDSWEFKMYDTKQWAEIDTSKHGTASVKKTCLECHRRYEGNDYVSDKGIQLLLKKG